MEKLPEKIEEKAVALNAFNQEQINLIKTTVAKGTTDDELKLFLYTAQKTGLDPLIRQIYAVKRFSGKDGKEIMSIQTGIDGYRLIAERTEKYAPGREPVIIEKEGKIISATAYVKKLVAGSWHEVAASAYYTEYVVKNNKGEPNIFWQKMPRLMLSKCAETLALRRAFPAEMANVHTAEEMGVIQERIEDVSEPSLPPKEETPFVPVISMAQRRRLFAIAKEAGKTEQQLREFLFSENGSEHTSDITIDRYEELCEKIAQK